MSEYNFLIIVTTWLAHNLSESFFFWNLNSCRLCFHRCRWHGLKVRLSVVTCWLVWWCHVSVMNVTHSFSRFEGSEFDEGENEFSSFPLSLSRILICKSADDIWPARTHKPQPLDDDFNRVVWRLKNIKANLWSRLRKREMRRSGCCLTTRRVVDVVCTHQTTSLPFFLFYEWHRLTLTFGTGRKALCERDEWNKHCIILECVRV